MEYGFHERPPQPDPYADEKKRLMEFIAQPQVQALGLGLFGGVPGFAARVLGLAIPLLGAAGKATRFMNAAPEKFVAERAKVPDQYQPFLSPHSVDELQAGVNKGGQVRMTPDSKTGYVLDPAGDLQNVFNTGPAGRGHAAVHDATRRGAQSLDAYEGFLPKMYKSHGFEPVDRLPFDPQYAPPGWENNPYLKDHPSVVMMRRQTPMADLKRSMPYNQLLDMKDAIEYAISQLGGVSPLATENIARSAQLPAKSSGDTGR